MKSDLFSFNFQTWLTDAKILSMDWDCRGIIQHLMLLSWDQNPRGYLVDDDDFLKKILNISDNQDWEKRIKPQILRYLHKTKISKTNYIYHPDLISKKNNKKKNIDLDLNIDNNENTNGFLLSSILNVKKSTTILYEPINEQESSTIWTIGVSLLKQQGNSEGQARAFLAKTIKEYGEKLVAQTIAQISIQSKPPAEIHSFIIGILRKNSNEVKKISGRGSVSI